MERNDTTQMDICPIYISKKVKSSHDRCKLNLVDNGTDHKNKSSREYQPENHLQSVQDYRASS